MAKLVFLAFFFFSPTSMAQKRAIDSINSLSFEEKIKRSSQLDDVFLKNAEEARKIGYPMGEADSYGNLSLVYYYQGKYNLNVDYSLKAIKIYEKIGAHNKLATQYAGLGYEMKRRNMPKALYYMRKGKTLAEQRSDSISMRSIYDNYGVLMEMQNKLDSALYYYQRGLVVKQNLHDSLGIPYSLNNIAGVSVMQKKFARAEELYGEAYKIRLGAQDEIGIAENLTYYGDLFYAKKDFNKALEFYKKSADQAAKYGYIYLMQGSYRKISECYERLGDNKNALENYKLYSQYKDSLLNKETNAKIAELDIKFEASEKEKQLAQHRNLLLQKEAENRHKNNLLVVLSILSLFIAVTGFMIYRHQRLKNRQLAQEHELKSAIARVETQNKLQEQRLRISRDLHDNIGSQLTFIISSVDNIKYSFDLKNSRLEQKLQSISSFTKETILELRDTIWAMNSSEITFENLLSRIANFIDKAQTATDKIEYQFQVQDCLQQVKVSSIVGMNIYRTIQEAINNAIKYSGASLIIVALTGENDGISITVSDNGNGFDRSLVMAGSGLINMDKRIREINGTFEIRSTPGKGTVVSIGIGDLCNAGE